MKKFFIIFLCIIGIFAGTGVILNISVTTAQGINFKQRKITIPLYLKLLDFLDRNYNYKELTKRIVQGVRTDQDKAMKILAWTYENIKIQPEELPVVDDHVWHIIVRGYGVSDQFSDVFTTLCNYAGITAWFSFVKAEAESSRIPLSLVRLNNQLYIFDPFNGVYFEDAHGELADIKQMRENNFKIAYLKEAAREQWDYPAYIKNIADERGQDNFKRAQIQSPWRRLRFEMSKWMKRK